MQDDSGGGDDDDDGRGFRPLEQSYYRKLAHQPAAQRAPLAEQFATRVDERLTGRITLDTIDAFARQLSILDLQPTTSAWFIEVSLNCAGISWYELVGMFYTLLAEHVARRGDPVEALAGPDDDRSGG
jgi:hypothetical protein